RDDEADQCYTHCIEAIRQTRGPDNHVLALARLERAWVWSRQGRAEQAEPEARESLAASNPPDPISRKLFYLGSVLARRGKLDEAEKLLLAAWNGDDTLKGMHDLPQNDCFRQDLVKSMILICEGRRDRDSAARWRKELQSAAD